MKFTPKIEQLFVNRDKELEAFSNILENKLPERLITLQAEGGQGKSWLIARFQHECILRRMMFADIDFRDTRVRDFLSILRRSRDGYGVKYFNNFTELVNRFTDPSPLQVKLGGGDTSISTTNDLQDVHDSNIEIAGRDIIKDNFISIPPISNRSTLQEMCERLTREFSHGLKTCIRDNGRPLVWLFDHIELLNRDTVDWLYDYFLTSMRDGELDGIIVVMAGRDMPRFTIEWEHIIYKLDLMPMEPNHFTEYAIKRGLEIGQEGVEWLYRVYDGQLQPFAAFVDKQKTKQISLS